MGRQLARKQLATTFACFCLMFSSVQAGVFRVVGVDTATAARLEQVADESCRTFSMRFYNKPFPKLARPVLIHATVTTGRSGSGHTSFMFLPGGVVHHAEIQVQGSRSALEFNAVPHEVMHVVNAIHFGRKTPRWFDEGVCSYIERDGVPSVALQRMAPFEVLLTQQEYGQDVTAFYRQSKSAVEFLLQHDVPTRLPVFVHDAAKFGWDRSLRRHYGYTSVREFELTWKEWVSRGAPRAVSKRRFPILRWLKGKWHECRMGHARFPQVHRLTGVVRQPAGYCEQCEAQPGSQHYVPPAPLFENEIENDTSTSQKIVELHPEKESEKTASPEIDYDRIVQEVLDRLPAPQPGAVGERGEQGPPGEVDYEKIYKEVHANIDYQRIASMVVGQMPKIQGPPGPPGPKGADGIPAPPINYDAIVQTAVKQVREQLAKENKNNRGSFVINIPQQ